MSAETRSTSTITSAGRPARRAAPWMGSGGEAWKGRYGRGGGPRAVIRAGSSTAVERVPGIRAGTGEPGGAARLREHVRGDAVDLDDHVRGEAGTAGGGLDRVGRGGLVEAVRAPAVGAEEREQ